MTLLRTLLVGIFAGLFAYTLIVGAHHGWNLLPIFFADLRAMTWNGQFNADFMYFLALSAVWVAWRHAFSLTGLSLGVVAFFGGSLFLSAYLLWASIEAKGDVARLLLGPRRA